MIENSVVSWPPCWVAVEVKAPPTLPCSAPLRPEAAGLIEEIRHLRRDAAEARAGADDDGVVMGEVLDLRHRRRLVELVMRRLRDLGRHQFRHALDVDASRRPRARLRRRPRPSSRYGRRRNNTVRELLWPFDCRLVMLAFGNCLRRVDEHDLRQSSSA